MSSGCVVSHRAAVEGLPAIVRLASRMQVRDQREVRHIPHGGVMDAGRYISGDSEPQRPRSQTRSRKNLPRWISCGDIHDYLRRLDDLDQGYYISKDLSMKSIINECRMIEQLMLIKVLQLSGNLN